MCQSVGVALGVQRQAILLAEGISAGKLLWQARHANSLDAKTEADWLWRTLIETISGSVENGGNAAPELLYVGSPNPPLEISPGPQRKLCRLAFRLQCNRQGSNIETIPNASGSFVSYC